MNATNFWEEKTQEEYLSAMNIFFEKMIDRMPGYIVSNNMSTKNYLESFNKQCTILKHNLLQIEKSDFDQIFKVGIDCIINDIENNCNKDLSYIMLPALYELIDIKHNVKVILEDVVQNKVTPKIMNWEDSNYEWECKAKEELNKMYVHFNFKSVQVNHGASWRDIYHWTQETYKAIIESQDNIGLEPFHAGLNQTVNLSFNPESLKQTKGNGKMFAHEVINTMVLTSFDKEIQKVIWQHEYAHILDNQVGIKLIKEQSKKSNTFINLNNKDEKINPCTFLSQIEMERQLKDDNIKWSSESNMYNAQVWMIEAISDVVCGASSDALKQYNLRCSEEFSQRVVENFNIQFFGEQNWLFMSENKKFNLLKNTNIIAYIDLIVEEIYEKGVRNFFTSYWEKTENINKFYNVVFTIKNIVQDDFLCDNAASNFKQELPQMSWNFLNIMKKYGYSNTNKQRYFPKSKTVIAAAQYSLNYISPYHSKILEIFARSCEDLQRPLILSTKEYFEEKEISLMNTQDFMNPQLNRNERKVFLKTIHALVEALGMKVTKQFDQLPALKETVINMAHMTYSSLSENEENADVILTNATRKTNKM